MQKSGVVLRPLWGNIPNAISMARLCATVVLLASVLLHRADIFKWLFLASLLSDILDGLIARTFHLTSKLGATLDSIADVLTMSIGVLGILTFQSGFVSEHYPGLLLVLGFYGAEVMAAFWRYGKVSSFHTWLDRVAALMAGIFVMWLFFYGYQGWLYQRTVAVYLLALTEEFLLIYLLPQWQSDVRGIYWVLTRAE
jgi:cardiolipin synthase